MSVLNNVQDILPYLNVLLDDKIVACDVEMQNNGNVAFLMTRIYTAHGLKIIVKITEQGNIYRWIEGIHESDCYCGS